MRRLVIVLTALCLCQFCAIAQPKPPIPTEVARKWEILQGGKLSNDGNWVAYTVRTVDGEGRLVVRGVDDSRSWTVAEGDQPVFGDDSRWVAYHIGVSEANAERLRLQGGAAAKGVGLMSLTDGNTKEWSEASTWRFLNGGRAFMVLAKDALTIVDLDGGSSSTVDGVSTVVADESGVKLALAAKQDDGSTTLQVVDLRSDTARIVAQGTFDPSGIVWARHSDTLACFVGDTVQGYEGKFNRVLVASGVSSDHPTLHVFDPKTRPEIPKDSRITETHGLRLSDDGERLCFEVASWNRTPEEGSPSVEIWHSMDRVTVPERRVEKPNGLAWIWDLKSDKLIQVTTSRRQTASYTQDLSYALVCDPNPYQTPAVRELEYHDVWVVRTADGNRTKVIGKAVSEPSISPTGTHAAVFSGKDWWLVNFDSGHARNVTSVAKVSFEDPEYDFATPYRLPAKGADWLGDGSGVLLFDGYDTWLAEPAGGIARLTQGRGKQIQYRRQKLDADWPMFFSTFDKRSKSSGFYRLDKPGVGRMLRMGADLVRDLGKARDADRLLLTMGNFEKSPNLFVTDKEFADPKPLTRLNPWQPSFRWGRSELLSYKSPAGKALNAVLIYPAGYEPGRKYPMVAYVYERLSDTLHTYYNPNEFSPFNPQLLSQSGYFVLLPDIVYELPRQPGQGATKCAEAALDAALARRVGVDASKVGVIGYSWGGYEAAYISTVSKRFAVGVCGSGLTDFASLSGLHYWKIGTPATALTELMQPRMAVPMWDDPKAYLDSSVIWQSPKRTAPLLIQVADKDDIVDWHQGLALYNALRRLGKEAVMLDYVGQNHNSMDRVDQLDFGRRLRHFLDVYLKGAKPETWVTQGYRD